MYIYTHTEHVRRKKQCGGPGPEWMVKEKSESEGKKKEREKGIRKRTKKDIICGCVPHNVEALHRLTWKSHHSTFKPVIYFPPQAHTKHKTPNSVRETN